MRWPPLLRRLAPPRSPGAAPDAVPDAVPEAFTAAVAAAHALLGMRPGWRQPSHGADGAGRARSPGRDYGLPGTAGLRELMVALARPRQWDHLTYTLRHHTAELAPVTLKNLFFAEVREPGSAASVFDGQSGRRVAPGAEIPLDPARHVILANPWRRAGLLGTLASIGAPGNPWTLDPGNHSVELLDPFGIALVHGGNHSIASGILRGELSLVAERHVDLRPWVLTLRCDGVRVTRADDGRVVGRVVDPVFGALLEIARLHIEWERDELGGTAAP